MNPTFAENGFFSFGSVGFPSDDGTGMAHGTSFGGCGAGDKAYNRFCAVFFDPVCGIGFHISADLTDHYDAFGFRVVHEEFNGIFGSSSDDGVTTDTNGCGLSEADLCKLVNSFIGKGS